MSNLAARPTRLRNEATALRNRHEFQRSQLTELASTDFQLRAKESFEIATKIAYRNGGGVGILKGGSMDCTIVAAAPVLPAGYVVSASRIADRRMIGGIPLGRYADTGHPKLKEIQFNPVEGDKLLDHSISPYQHVRWNRQADLVGCFQIDDKLKLFRLLHREIGSLGTLL